MKATLLLAMTGMEDPLVNPLIRNDGEGNYRDENYANVVKNFVYSLSSFLSSVYFT